MSVEQPTPDELVMTKREQFAMHCAAAIISTVHSAPDSVDEAMKIVAKLAVKAADALLDELSK